MDGGAGALVVYISVSPIFNFLLLVVGLAEKNKLNDLFCFFLLDLEYNNLQHTVCGMEDRV